MRDYFRRRRSDLHRFVTESNLLRPMREGLRFEKFIEQSRQPTAKEWAIFGSMAVVLLFCVEHFPPARWFGLNSFELAVNRYGTVNFARSRNGNLAILNQARSKVDFYDADLTFKGSVTFTSHYGVQRASIAYMEDNAVTVFWGPGEGNSFRRVSLSEGVSFDERQLCEANIAVNQLSNLDQDGDYIWTNQGFKRIRIYWILGREKIEIFDEGRVYDWGFRWTKVASSHTVFCGLLMYYCVIYPFFLWIYDRSRSLFHWFLYLNRNKLITKLQRNTNGFSEEKK